MDYLPNLKAEMERYSVDEAAVASAASRTKKTVQNWFKGIGEPSYLQAKRIKDELFPDFEIEYLFSPEPINPATSIRKAG